MRARVFLRQPLFTLPGSLAHLPASTVVIEGECTTLEGVGLRIEAQVYLDEKGRKLEGAPCVVVLSASKLDHLHVLD